MTQQRQEGIQAEAIEWHVRLRDGGPEDWNAFILWLEADPAHSDAYDRVKFADAAIHPDMVPVVRSPVAANDESEEPARGHGPRGRIGFRAATLAAVAAIFVAILVALPWLTAGPSRYEIATAAGERKNVELGEGSSAVLNGSTRLILDRDDARYAELAAGEATFTVRHDDARPFQVVAGDHRVLDAGTIFNLVHDRDRFSVEVIEGAVVYDPAGADVSLTAGQTLLVRRRHTPPAGSASAAGHDRLATRPAQLPQLAARDRGKRPVAEPGDRSATRSGLGRDAVYRLHPCRRQCRREHFDASLDAWTSGTPHRGRLADRAATPCTSLSRSPA